MKMLVTWGLVVLALFWAGALGVGFVRFMSLLSGVTYSPEVGALAGWLSGGIAAFGMASYECIEGFPISEAIIDRMKRPKRETRV